MIDEIRVQNLALIREATMTPARGLTVLTGETGAGKTALLSACKLLMGARADKSIVREGEKSALAQGRFFFGEGGDADDLDELVVTRRLTADGRSRVNVNGSMASVSELAETIAPTMDLCGQHEHQLLMKPTNHVKILDVWAGEGAAVALASYQSAYERAARAARELERIREAQTSSAVQLDEARFTLRQIDAVDPVAGEYEDLVAYLGKAENAEALARAADGAYQGLSGDGGALDGVVRAIASLEEGSRYDEVLAPYAESLREASYVLEDVSREALAYRDGVECDYEELARAQERVSAMQSLMRAYGPRMEDVFASREAAREAVSLVDDADVRERAALKEVEAAEAALAHAAEELHQVRGAAAPQLAAEVTNVMRKLEMGTSELVCRADLLERDAWSTAGPSAVEFFFRPGTDMQPRPLARIASGGEVSRVMLSIKVVLGERDEASTLVFDEVDAGVGGATAVSLAQVLADLSKTHQVIVVTHLAQVAVAGDAHYVVRKQGDSVPETELCEVEGEERVCEIARMLSGNVTEASCAHAREMLEAAVASCNPEDAE